MDGWRKEMDDKEPVKIGPRYQILEFFSYEHLPPHLAEVSKPFCDLAVQMAQVPMNPETAAGLRKLLEAKDCAVRASVAARSAERGR